jgi:hypothetical protein
VSATPEMIGKPSPEGIHKDGVTFSTLFCVDRVDADGAENILYDNEKTEIAKATLTSRGDCILFADERVYHYVTPMSVRAPAASATRDMLFIEFIAQGS